MNIVAGALAGNGPGAGWRIGPDEAAGHHLVTAYGGNNTSGPRAVASALLAHGGGRMDFESETFIAHAPSVHGTPTARSSRGGGQANSPGHNADEALIAFDTTQITSAANRSNPRPGDPCHPLAAGAHAPAIAIQEKAMDPNPANGPQSKGYQAGLAYTMEARSRVQAVAHAAAVRRLTPWECEFLQGFPRSYTAIPWRGRPAGECPDGPRYKALGNSWAVNCARWIGRRISLVESIHRNPREAA